jgi:hypothetical protein
MMEKDAHSEENLPNRERFRTMKNPDHDQQRAITDRGEIITLEIPPYSF